MNNKGFTLLELIIVVAIIGTLTVFSGTWLSLLTSTTASAATTDIQALMSQTRVAALSGSINPRLEIVNEDGSYYAITYVNEEQTSRELIGDGKISISATMNDDTVDVIEESEKLTISFDGETGAFKSPAFKAITVYNQVADYTIGIVASTGHFEVV